MSNAPSDGSRPNVARRHFLRGAGGLLLSIPFLGSLYRDKALAQTAARKRFVAMITGHGGAWGADMHPDQATLTDAMSYAGQMVRRGDLALSVSSGRASLSPILSADSGVFTASLASKMNVMRGFGLPFPGFHHRGGHLGNWATIDGNPHGLSNRPTIDNIIAYSPGFYEATPLVRVMVCGFDHPGVAAHSWLHENPVDKAGPVVMSSPAGDSRRLFDRIYTPMEPSTETPRRPVVDRVLADYRRLRANARLSARDRERLDAHIAHLDDLERKLSRPRASCGDVEPVENNDALRFIDHEIDPALAAEKLRLWCDVVALAFSCDTSRIAVIPILSSFSDWDGTGARDFHQALAHQAGHALDATLGIQVDDPHPRFRMAETYQRMFEQGFLYLASRLEEIADGEGSVLDSSLVAWTHEAGLQTHDQTDMPVVTIGSAGGAMRTGSFADYRNTAYRGGPSDPVPEVIYPGLHWHQYLGSVIQLMGVSPSEYQSGSYGGYGDEFVEPAIRDANLYPEATFTARGDVLPFLTR